jgi:hypothetical protein
VQGDFDYSQLTFPTAAAVEDEERREDVGGTGDRLDPLLNILPGLDGEAQAQAQEYAAEVMGASDASTDDEDGELFADDDDDDGDDNIIDF